MKDILTDTLLKEGLLKLGLETEGRPFSLLVKYIEEIELFNPSYGLVKVKDREELIVKHILDSLSPIGIFQGTAGAGSFSGLQGKPAVWQIADVGSGAGLPGIPLAIFMPHAEFTLIERMGRRAGFLRDVQALLGLSNLKVEETEMEKLSKNRPAQNKDCPGRFNIIVFRAFKPLTPAILKSLFALLAPGGTLAAYKGRRESIEEEMAQVSRSVEKPEGSSFCSYEILPLEVPFLEEERHLVLIRPE